MQLLNPANVTLQQIYNDVTFTFYIVLFKKHCYFDWVTIIKAEAQWRNLIMWNLIRQRTALAEQPNTQ